MIYGRERADIADEHGEIILTVTDVVVSIKQSGDLIRATRTGARELANDILACLDALEGKS